MSWFCEICGDLFLDFGEDYCEDCRKIIKRQEEIKRIKRKRREEKKEKIKKEINKYKNIESLHIKEKYRTMIDFVSDTSKYKKNVAFFFIENEDKVKIISKDKTLQNKIGDLKKESRELEEALKELEDIKNEILK